MKDYDRLHAILSQLLDEFGVGDTLTVLGVQIRQKADPDNWEKHQRLKRLSDDLHQLSMGYQYPNQYK